MKQICFLFIGKPKNKSFAELEVDYLSKIKHYAAVTVTHLKDGRASSVEARRAEESQFILEKIKKDDLVVVCDEHGQSRTSSQLANNLKNWMEQSQRVVFVVGGAFGMTQELIKSARVVLKLSEFTFPHELARVVLLEQVYRAFTILSGQKYHH
jgi:23S rRNA (pseudouridine1915-N3)-methyltransferase